MSSILPDTDPQDNTPLPLQVSAKWKFPLAHLQVENNMLYAIQDWIRGLTGSDNPSRIWSDAKRSIKQAQLFDSIVELPYVAGDGKTYQVEHTIDKGLYIIAQNLRVTKSRPAPAAIKRFLAEAGAFVDQVRLNPIITLLRPTKFIWVFGNALLLI